MPYFQAFWGSFLKLLKPSLQSNPSAKQNISKNPLVPLTERERTANGPRTDRWRTANGPLTDRWRTDNGQSDLLLNLIFLSIVHFFVHFFVQIWPNSSSDVTLGIPTSARRAVLSPPPAVTDTFLMLHFVTCSYRHKFDEAGPRFDEAGADLMWLGWDRFKAWPNGWADFKFRCGWADFKMWMGKYTYIFTLVPEAVKSC